MIDERMVLFADNPALSFMRSLYDHSLLTPGLNPSKKGDRSHDIHLRSSQEIFCAPDATDEDMEIVRTVREYVEGEIMPSRKGDGPDIPIEDPRPSR